ncbi:MAG: PadR family transcriptional regulator [Candidatus Odinarchaeota archaeon]|nr:PadR family transcriptional regulator [Candidatus Thorarchaeota archaeon]
MSKKIKLFLPTPAKLTPIQLLIMIQLLESPKYGYEILSSLRNGFKGSWEPKTGTIYPALQSLEKKAFITSNLQDNKTHYSLTKQGKSMIDDMSNYVAEYIMFNTKFIESTVASLPADFTQEVFSKIHNSGIDEIIPEGTILDAISRLSNTMLKQAFLQQRQRILKRKMKLVEHHLKALET